MISGQEPARPTAAIRAFFSTRAKKLQNTSIEWSRPTCGRSGGGGVLLGQRLGTDQTAVGDHPGVMAKRRRSRSITG